jgi:hypothetical protein
MDKVIAYIGLISGLITAIDYFVKKEQLEKFEDKIRIYLIEFKGNINIKSVISLYKNMAKLCLFVNTLMLIFLTTPALIRNRNYMNAFQDIFVFTAGIIFVPIMICFYYVVFILPLFIFIKFIIWTPKGVIKGIFAPLAAFSAIYTFRHK